MSHPTPARRRAIFLDVDGTILADGHRIEDSTISGIREARAAGHLVFLSTGRAHAELFDELMSIGFDGVVSNGGAFATIDDDVIVSRLLPAESVAQLEEHFAARGIHWYFQSYDRLFASPELPALMSAYLQEDTALHAERARAAGVDPADLPFHSVGGKVFAEPADFDAHGVAKAVILSDDADAISRACEELSSQFSVVTGTIPLPLGASGEVALLGVDKGATILELLTHLGIDPADSIGIGDNWNDVEMFDACGLSIAMGNAVPGVQACADEVTTPIDEDGIWNAFVRHGLVQAR